jgi:uncharacterized DUF497 family protein
MVITELIWLTTFVEKLEQKHAVSTDEVEQALSRNAQVRRIARGDVSGEDLYRVVGRTDTGRYLAIFFIYKGRGRALVISARDASRRERKSYGKSKQ